MPLTPARRHVAPDDASGAPARAPFVELGLVTCFSFLRGASDPVDLVLAAHRLGYDAMGVADANSMAGAVRIHGETKALGLRPVIGCRIEMSRASFSSPIRQTAQLMAACAV